MKLNKLSVFAAQLPLALILGCSSGNDGADAGTSVGFSVLSNGFNLTTGTDNAKLLETYRDQASYENALSAYSLTVDGVVIDFASEQVVLVSSGSQSSGGHSIAVESVKDIGDFIELNVLFSSPGANCIATAAFTHPFQLLAINALKEVRTNERNVVEDCG